MASPKKSRRIFQGMSYREVQSSNSKCRTKLHKEDQKWLKDNNYKNIGWDKIIILYQKIEDFLDKYALEDTTLEELFLEADRIGNRYLTNIEIEEFNQKMSKEVNEISKEIDKQFPDTEIEFIDFGKNEKNSNQKSYRTIKF
jgi:C-terminal processing protease CtpA/Prc